MKKQHSFDFLGALYFSTWNSLEPYGSVAVKVMCLESGQHQPYSDVEFSYSYSFQVMVSFLKSPVEFWFSRLAMASPGFRNRFSVLLNVIRSCAG